MLELHKGAQIFRHNCKNWQDLQMQILVSFQNRKKKKTHTRSQLHKDGKVWKHKFADLKGRKLSFHRSSKCMLSMYCHITFSEYSLGFCRCLIKETICFCSLVYDTLHYCHQGFPLISQGYLMSLFNLW